MRCFAVILLASLGLTSCAPANRAQLEQEALKADPEFAAVLEKHRELANRIETYKRELALKRSTIERNIAQLRKDLAVAVSGVRAKAEDVKKRMSPDRERLELALSLASEELRAKRSQRASVGRSIAQLKKALKTSGPTWTAQERARQEAQIQDLLHDAQRLDQELTGLKAHVRLLKIKLYLIAL